MKKIKFLFLIVLFLFQIKTVCAEEVVDLGTYIYQEIQTDSQTNEQKINKEIILQIEDNNYAWVIEKENGKENVAFGTYTIKKTKITFTGTEKQVTGNCILSENSKSLEFTLKDGNVTYGTTVFEKKENADFSYDLNNYTTCNTLYKEGEIGYFKNENTLIKIDQKGNIELWEEKAQYVGLIGTYVQKEDTLEVTITKKIMRGMCFQKYKEKITLKILNEDGIYKLIYNEKELTSASFNDILEKKMYQTFHEYEEYTNCSKKDTKKIYFAFGIPLVLVLLVTGTIIYNKKIKRIKLK